ncbi:hypothetical protein FW774_18010 [Pedobacter sp. BS3]|nr:hypothetical protein FW774_18010 [Pedobacter sp. BS3]
MVNSLMLYAQSGAHTPSSAVWEVFFSSDGKRCLTMSLDEAVLWDYPQKKTIWIKKAADLGGFRDLGLFEGANTDPGLNYLIKKNPSDVRPWAALIDLNTFRYIGWGWGQLQFASDGRIPVIQPNQGRNQNILYIIDPKTLEKEKIADKMYRIHLAEKGELIVITQQDKNFHENRKDNRYYSIKEKKFVDGDVVDPKSYYNTQLGRYVVKGEENLKYHKVELVSITGNEGVTTNFIKCRDQDDKEIKSFPIANPQSIHWAKTKICFISPENTIVKVLEHKRMVDNSDMSLSFVNTYNYLTGQLLDSFELTNSSANVIASAQAILDQGKAKAQQQAQINNLPENQLKQRVNMLSFNGSYVINQKTLRIYKLQPEKAAYKGGMVSLEAITSAGNLQAFEKIDNLENKAMYKSIKGYKVCPYCQGKGATQTYKEHEIDQTLSKGRIITETTTYTHGCQSCGGGGIIPL